MSKVAALYVDTRGVYSALPGVECWGLPERDAREYAGPWPVIAHPPCARWSILAQGFHPAMLGLDDGCFAATLAAVERWGGVLEHPQSTAAWRVFDLPRATFGWWNRSLERPGWATCVWQGAYGHEVPKPTWLYYVGACAPRPLRWERIDPGGRLTRLPGRGAERRHRREATPPAFAAVLLELVRQDEEGGAK